jgi:hypothetical protein
MVFDYIVNFQRHVEICPKDLWKKIDMHSPLYAGTLQFLLTYIRYAFAICVFSLARADIYHIDSRFSGDSSQGTLEKPYKSLSILQGIALKPGDKVLLKRGSIFRERLLITPSGSQQHPIQVGAYGEGPAPLVSAGEALPSLANWQGPDPKGLYSLDLGPTVDFYTSVPVLIKIQGTKKELLEIGNLQAPAANTYATDHQAVTRTVFYRPDSAENPSEIKFEISKRNYAIRIDGDWVEVENINAELGNDGHPTFDPPQSSASVVVKGNHVLFAHATIRFSRGNGIESYGHHTTIEDVTAEHNKSTGIALLTPASHHGQIRHNVARFNGNLTWDDLDRGGIGVQGDDVLIQGNVVHDNGNRRDYIPPRIAGDDAIILFECARGKIIENFVANSPRTAISVNWSAKSYGHQIKNNIIVEWNLMNLPGTNRTMAILAFGYGNLPQSGTTSIENNTLHSSFMSQAKIGIQVGLPTKADRYRNSVVARNFISLPIKSSNTNVGIRIVRPELFENAAFEDNVIHGALRSFLINDSDAFNSERELMQQVFSPSTEVPKATKRP